MLKLPKGASLLSGWRRCLKSINSDGSWAAISLDTLQKAATVSQYAALTAEFSNVLMEILSISEISFEDAGDKDKEEDEGDQPPAKSHKLTGKRAAPMTFA